MELLLVIVVGVPIVIGLFYVLLAELREKDNDRTVQRCEPLISDCRWTRKKFYDDAWSLKIKLPNSLFNLIVCSCLFNLTKEVINHG